MHAVHGGIAQIHETSSASLLRLKSGSLPSISGVLWQLNANTPQYTEGNIPPLIKPR